MTHRRRAVTVQEINDPQQRAALPDGWTGVTWHWPDRDFTECRKHIEKDTEPTGPDVPADLIGTVRFDAIECGRAHPVVTGQERAALAIENRLRGVDRLADTLRRSAEELRQDVRAALKAGATTQEISALVAPAVDRALHDVASIRGLVPPDDPLARLRQYRHDHGHSALDRNRGLSL